MRVRALAVVLASLVAGGAQSQPGMRTQCGSACLEAAIDDYLAKMLGHRTGEIHLAADALIYVNTHPMTLNAHPLGRARAIRSRQVFCDPESGNVIARTGLEIQDGGIAYASTRLRIVGGIITEVETSFDEGSRVARSYVTHLDPLMTTIVPRERRMTRAELKAMVMRYFASLTTHNALAADFDERCDRYHSGQRITNNARNTVEGGVPMTCYTALLGDRPWGPATDIRVPLVDPEHGIVAGYTVLLYRDRTAPMYVSEVFKILDGRIRMIDNIGLKADGIKAMNVPE